jgi:SAM-dependent methyltransferase
MRLAMGHCFYCGLVFAGHSFTTREMMFGTRDEFEYAQCPSCHSCVLLTPRDSFDLGNYYPRDYYSFNEEQFKSNSLESFLRHRRGEHLFGRPNFIGAVMSWLKPMKYTLLSEYSGLSVESSILDVGSGNGVFLSMLAENGFLHLRGCDPYIDEPIQIANINIQKCAIEDMKGLYQFIFFNHSFEHLPNPSQSLRAARSLQPRGGACIIRTPTTSSKAFERYGPNWVQLDPPRHISVPSREGMRALAHSSGYRLERMIDDSGAFQFWGSEQYVKDIPLTSDKSYYRNPANSMFSEAEIARFEIAAREANNLSQGDQTAFVLRAADE